MKDVILHVGHGKTGSSYLQSFLSLNKGRLAEMGIYYPHHPSFREAKAGRITSGNGAHLMRAGYAIKDDQTSLFSSEFLFHSLLERDLLQRKVLDKSDRVRVIVYTRNVMEMLASTWGQHVKRGGETRSFDQYLREADIPHFRALLTWFLKSRTHGFDIVARNYSVHREEVVQDFMNTLMDAPDFFALHQDLFAFPQVKTINRSMTEFEYAFLRIMNRSAPKLGKQISDAWVNQLPDIASEPPKVAADTFESMRDRYLPVIEDINSHLPSEEAICFGDEADFVYPAGVTAGVTDPQVEIVSKAFEDVFANTVEAIRSFDPQRYLDLHPDVADTGMNPYEHYMRYGFNKGRKLR